MSDDKNNERSEHEEIHHYSSTYESLAKSYSADQPSLSGEELISLMSAPLLSPQPTQDTPNSSTGPIVNDDSAQSTSNTED